MANTQDDASDHSDRYDDPDLTNVHDVPMDQMEDLQRTLADSDNPDEEP